MDKFWCIDHNKFGIYCGSIQGKPQWDRFVLRRDFRVEKYETIGEAEKVRNGLLQVYDRRSLKITGPFLPFSTNS